MFPAPRLASGAEALGRLMSSDEPAVNKCRVQTALSALYLLGDTSGQEFGTGLWDGKGILYNAASLAHYHRNEISNWKEVNNLTTKVEDLAKTGGLHDADIFIFVDNMAFGGTFFKGRSRSKKLNGVILRIRLLEVETGCILHGIHTAGTRMKRAGIGGLSCEDFLEDVMAGRSPLKFIPLDEGADERSDSRVENGHDSGMVIYWSPPWLFKCIKAFD